MREPWFGPMVARQHLNMQLYWEPSWRRKESVTEVEGRQIKLSNLEKVLYPKAGFTKGQVIDYYVRIAPVLLPHLAGRPLTLKRYPNGVDGMYFYEKNCPKYRPDWMQDRQSVWSEGNNRFMDYCVVAGSAHAGLAGQPGRSRTPYLACSRAGNHSVPRSSLSISIPALRPTSCSAARSGFGCAKFLSSSGCRAFPKTSGSKGLQVYVPLNTAVTYEQTKPFAKAIARLAGTARHPGRSGF